MKDPVGASHVDRIVCAVPSMSSAATVVARTSCIIYIYQPNTGKLPESQTAWGQYYCGPGLGSPMLV